MLRKAKDIPGWPRSNNYHMAWCGENRRIHWVNYGVRALESILMPPVIIRDWMGRPVRIPRLTVRDYEVAEVMAAWLGSDEGQIFINTCETEIDTRREAERHQRKAERLLQSVA